DAYVNQQQAVLDAVQTMRKRAQQAGNLNTTPQENVVTQGQTIVIEPANPDVVYVPAYDPWLVYGPPLVAYPGWYWYPGLYARSDAYVNQQQAVLDAVQTMRKRAQQAGNLNTTPQENVVTQGQTIVIEPANPDVVYVPAYDPWLVYGPPLVAYPGWYWYPGLYAVGPGISFGFGFGIGFFGGFGWGFHHWGFDWHDRFLRHDHDRYEAHDHDHFHRGG